MAKVLCFAGSVRKDSHNGHLLAIAAERARLAGAQVREIDLADYPLPLFDQDLEAERGGPEEAGRLRQVFLESDALLLASPEYNSSITPLLKNTIDWVSRRSQEQPSLAAFQGKIAALMSASPGELGGLRSLVHLRSILSNIGVVVMPAQLAVPRAHEVIDAENRQLNDPRLDRRLTNVVQRLVDFAKKTSGPAQR